MTTLRGLRTKQGLTQAVFAKSIGLQRSTYVRLELGQRRLDLVVLRRISDTLKLSDAQIADLVRSAAGPDGDPDAADPDPHGDDDDARHQVAA